MERIRNIAIAKIAMLFRMSLINNCLVRGRLLSHMVTFFSKGLSIYYVIRNGGGGLPDLLQYYIGGGVPNLLQYYIGGGLESLLQCYSFERKMEGYIPFSALY